MWWEGSFSATETVCRRAADIVKDWAEIPKDSERWRYSSGSTVVWVRRRESDFLVTISGHVSEVPVHALEFIWRCRRDLKEERLKHDGGESVWNHRGDL